MATLHMTRGLPGSGKSTWARTQTAESNGQTVDVTKDELRNLPDAPEGRKRERWVCDQRDLIAAAALAAGKDVIVHDTNFNPVHEAKLRQIAREASADFTVVDFTHVPVDECVRRDLLRENPVGADVIRGMWQQYLYTPPQPDKGGLLRTVIVDIDGTIARMNGRRPFDWARVGTDLPVSHVIELVKGLAATGTTIVYMSGRDGSCREATQEWLDVHVAVPGMLLMRPAGDTRKDSLVKAELFREHLVATHSVQFVLDDRDQVVSMWRTELGLPCLQVDYGMF